MNTSLVPKGLFGIKLGLLMSSLIERLVSALMSDTYLCICIFVCADVGSFLFCFYHTALREVLFELFGCHVITVAVPSSSIISCIYF